MRLILNNFRCYESKEFDLGENGITLISGNSGKGKTTILKAIHFALFDHGKSFEIIKHGCKDCFVIFEIENLIHIKRSRRPNTLVVDHKYNDEVGESIIKNIFSSVFQNTAYIEQNSFSSFLFMNSTDKLRFLEKFAFENCNVSLLKHEIKTKLKKLNQDYLKFSTELESFETIKKQYDSLEKIKKLPCFDQINESKLKEYILEKDKLLEMIHRFEYKITDIKRTKDELKESLSMEDKFNSDITKSEKIMNSIQLKSSDYINECKSKLNFLIKEKRWVQLSKDKTKLHHMKNSEMKSNHKKIQELDLVLWKEYSKDEIEEILLEQHELLTDVKKVQSLDMKIKKYKNFQNTCDICKLTNDIQEINKNIEQLYTYSCPHCEKKVYLHNHKLHKLIDDSIKTPVGIDILKKRLKILEEKKDTWTTNHRYIKLYEKEKKQITSVYEDDIHKENTNEIMDYINELKKYKQQQLHNESIKSTLQHNIKHNIYSSSILHFETHIKKESMFFKNHNSVSKYEHLESELYYSKEIEDETSKINKKKLLGIDIKRLQDRLKELRFQNEKKRDKISHLVTYIDKIESLQIKHHRIEKQINDFHKCKLLKAKYEHYMSEKTKLDILNKKISRNEKVLSNLSNDIILYKQYQDSILESESLSVSYIVKELNRHVQIFLNQFFTTDILNIQLRTFKESKKMKKPSLNIELQYKGCKTNLASLSGGELSRINLAFTLAFSEIYNFKFILLDECTSSLDETITNDIIDVLQEHFSEKLVILIAHQVVTGQFDKIISL